MKSFVILTGLLWCAEAAGQVTGAVSDDTGQPLTGAEVILWGDGRLLSRVATDRSGRFQAEVDLSDVRRLSAHFLGYQTKVVPLDAAQATDVTMALTPLPLPLPELTVVVAQDGCSEPDDPRARALWNEARSRYAADTGRRGGLVGGHIEEGDVRSDRLGEVQAGVLVPTMRRWEGGGRPSTSFLWELLEDRVASDGYAWRPERRLELGLRHLNWEYPAFEERHGYHFATPEFGAAHRFQILSEGSAGVELAYCGKDRDRPWLHGSLVIGSDSMFVSARWSVVTEEPNENAGGELIFAEARDANGELHLVSARGIFWRHNGSEAPYPDLPRSYHQIAIVNVEWIISLDSAMPDCRPRWCAI